MFCEMVAENIMVCRGRSHSLRMVLISPKNPNSNMVSASSKIMVLTLIRFILLSRIKSCNRPGVATTISAPCESRWSCVLLGVPP
ncbi:MAG: hypothetical protein KU29_07200 [Sulfurovum sp. FS06-10]|nr:MAG: hypothetical protein KU29_07200 [Sulfurovum sp. FS06-10]